ncbi:hypothetical protein [Streptomyces sp. NPDC088794]|uniref:hypothetical protein n=1 Tax=Streptomyces sp. NPDC088794 TaxID=3365902 RepID=UPI00382CDED0
MPGTVLLLAASPVGRGCLVDAASVLPVLAAVPPAVLSGTDTANVVELADPLEPQAVLTRLRAAATAPGPLTLFVTGQLQLDRRQRLPHLALARTTPSTVRYTGLPWQWIREELRLRPPGATTILFDLHADVETWEWLRSNPLDCGRNNAVYGRAAPPPGRRTVAVPTYMKAVATILRSGFRPPVEQLHQQALARVGPDGFADLLFASEPGVMGTVPGGTVPGGTVPGGSAPRPPYRPERPRPQTPDGLENERSYGEAADPGKAADPGRGHDLGRVSDPGRAPDPGRGPGPGRAPDSGRVPDPGRAPDPGRGPGPGRAPDSGRAPDPGTSPALGRGPDPGRAAAPGRSPDPGRAADPGKGADPYVEISAAVQSGRHPDADALAATHEQLAVRAHGPGSEDALHWAEVRADLAMFAGDPVRSCRTWLAVAGARLTAGWPADAPDVEAAVDRAHHQWGQVVDPVAARELGAELADLRSRVPGRREGALDHVQRQLRQLQTQS